jgi:hypothetical protein
VPKIESIRPGGTLEGSFAEYPLAELLVGVLRGNLTGSLELMLHPERHNVIYFKDGVPVSVVLPDLGVSVARMLAEKGVIAKDTALEIMRQVEETGRTESALILEERILSQGGIVEARRRRAREQIVRLFDAVSADFRFTEGIFDETSQLTILQPLPIVFEGLMKSRDRTVVARFLEDCGNGQFKLGPTYPRGVDPFEWGQRVEGTIGSLDQPMSILELENLGLDHDLVSAAMTTLHLAGMLETVHTGHSGKMRAVDDETDAVEYVNPRGEPMPRSSRSTPKAESGPDSPASSGDDRDPSGLVIVRRSSGAIERPRSDPRGTPIDSKEPSGGFRPVSRSEAESAQHEAQLDQIAAKLNPLRGKSYFKILRVSDAAPAEQIERSFRYLIRQVDEQGDDLVMRALRDTYREAYDVLMDSAEGRRYRDLNERAKQTASAAIDRQAFEATQKVERAVRCLIEGRYAEALHLFDWALQLEPARKDVKVYRALVRYFRAPRNQRSQEAHAMKATVAQEVQRAPHDRTMLLAYALILAEDRDAAGAEQLIARAERLDHPLVRRIREVLLDR